MLRQGAAGRKRQRPHRGGGAAVRMRARGVTARRPRGGRGWSHRHVNRSHVNARWTSYAHGRNGLTMTALTELWGIRNGLNVDDLDVTTDDEIDAFLNRVRKGRGPLDPGPQYEMRA